MKRQHGRVELLAVAVIAAIIILVILLLCVTVKAINSSGVLMPKPHYACVEGYKVMYFNDLHSPVQVLDTQGNGITCEE